MSDWTAGYVADIGYTFGYYTELNPLRVKLAFLNEGIHFPTCGAACELGFGQGMSVNMHAAASVTQWYGTDFNPSQADFAQTIASVCGSGAQLFDESFVEFANRSDLPEFDYIGLHGIWSWVNDENRAIIVDFIKRKLKVGGVLYISYNTQPGWAAMVPMRDLLTEYSDVMGRRGLGIVNRIDEALVFAEKLMTVNPTYARANPIVSERIKKLKEQNRSYLAHEYFNKDWLPMPFSKMAEWLSAAKLQFACSAHYLDHIDAVNLTIDQRSLLNEIPDTMLRQTVRDFCTNQQFRKDYWVKGARVMTPLQRSEALHQIKVILVTPRGDVSLKVTGSIGEANLSEAIYHPILDCLSDYKVKSLGQLKTALKDEAILFTQILEAVMVLSGSGTLMLVQEDTDISKSKKHTDKLNQYLMSFARGSNDINFLASPVTGGGVSIGRFQQLFLQAYTTGLKKPSEWASYVWDILSQQGQKIIKADQQLETVEENLLELTDLAQSFHTKHLPIMKALQIV